MSAFLVSDAHIDYLVAAGITLGIFPADIADDVGEMFLSENHASLAARYRDETDHERHVYREPSRPIEPVQVIKAAQCHDYQSCEHDEWNTSNARQVLDAIRDAALARLPARMREMVPSRYNGPLHERIFSTDAYSTAEWCIYSHAPAVAQAVA